MENEENEIEKVSISKAGLDALNEIRGLNEKAHYLVICGAKQARKLSADSVFETILT